MLKTPKKSLGQNFLIDNNISELLVNLGEINCNSNVLEIGPGTGNLTRKIIKKRPKKLILVEKDKFLAEQLNKEIQGNFKLISDDILKIDEEEIFEKNLIIFGNLPYNISTQILTKFIKNQKINLTCKKYIFMFQKEVADRILAKTNDKEYGRLSIISNWRMNITKIKEINPTSFFPVPKVKSTILIFEPKKKFFKILYPKNLEFITQTFFSYRRKMIKKPLQKLFGNIEKISKKLNIDINNRPQNLTPEMYFKICKEYENLFC